MKDLIQEQMQKFDLWARQFVVVRDKDVVLPFLHILGFAHLEKLAYIHKDRKVSSIQCSTKVT
jgi:hypothetical protein